MTSTGHYAILRVKRKRTDDIAPLDALVLDSQGHSSKRIKRDDPGAGVFRFAQTVPAEAFDSAHAPDVSHRHLIESLLKSGAPATTTAPTVTPSSHTTAEQQAPRYRFKRVRDQVDYDAGHRPPVVREAGKSVYQLFDAFEESARGSRSSLKPKIIRSPRETEAEKRQMDAFLPMLESYLSLDDRPSRPISPTPDASLPRIVQQDDEDNDAEYVYDLYLRDLGSKASGVDVDSLAGLKRIGQLAALDEDELLSNNLSSEEEDEADEDSNDENDYRNDYPDEDEGDSDEEW